MHPNDYNCPFHGRFMNFLPKSLLVVLIDVLIYVFPTHFDRGLKVRLFVRHNVPTISAYGDCLQNGVTHGCTRLD